MFHSKSLHFQIFLLLLSTHASQSCNKQFFQNLSDYYKLQDQQDHLVIFLGDYPLQELCRDSIPNLPKMQLLQIINNNLNYIEPGAFSNLGQVDLILESNLLTTVSTGVFSGTDVTEICLTNNRIVSIEAEAFNNMPFLRSIYLNDNKVTRWNTDWFRNTPRLLDIIFSGNQIEQLPERMLKNLHGKTQLEEGTFHTHLLLDHNKIQHIHPNAFTGITKFGQFNLAGNMLTSIPVELFRNYTKINTIDLSSNRLTCLSDDALFNMRNIEILKLEGNPLEEGCKQKIQLVRLHGNLL